MSNLENQAKPILIPLISGEQEVVEFGREERLILARWVCKTGYMLNSCSNYEAKVPSSHFAHLFNSPDSLPTSVVVVAQQHHGSQKFYWLQHQFIMKSDVHPYVSSREEAELLIGPSYKISFQFNKLLLLVAYWPWPDWQMVLWPGIHVPLWPQKGPIGWYREDPISGGFPWFDSLEALVTFHQTLGIVRENMTTRPPTNT